MRTSHWLEIMTDPRTGEQTMVRADTQEELDRQIAVWREAIDEASRLKPSVSKLASRS
jgi:hypothetical protein